MEYLLIDGNNLAVRNAFASKDLVNSQGIYTGSHFGFFNSIYSLKRQFPNAQFLVAWDSKSKRRVEESKAAVIKKIVPEHYKENRKKKPPSKPLEDFYSSHDLLKKALGKLGVPQIHIPGYEADDVLVTYARLLTANSNNNAILVTSDRDYYQALSSNILIWDGMKSVTKTIDTLKEELGLTPSQYIDFGAIMGDDGDNIFGVPGWGEKTTLKEITENTTWQNVVSKYKAELSKYRDLYPDLNTLVDIVATETLTFDDMKQVVDKGEYRAEFEKSVNEIKQYYTVIKETANSVEYTISKGQKMFNELANVLTPKGNPKWPDIYFDQPYTGVAYAIEKGTIKASKTSINVVMFEDRIKLAYSLKKIDEDLETLPNIVNGQIDLDKLFEYFDYYEMNSLKPAASQLFGASSSI